MPSLSRELRRLLERTIAGIDGARQIAEDGAEQSLKRLAVDRHEPHTSLTPEERMLRNQLRAYGRQLGDKRDLQRGTQTINHLKQAVAYEHWHRLLFARFPRTFEQSLVASGTRCSTHFGRSEGTRSREGMGLDRTGC